LFKYLLLAFADFWYIEFLFYDYCGAAGVYFFLVTVYWFGEKLWGK